SQLPYAQRELIILHLQSKMRFRQIAKSKGVSANTIQSRYRYGLNKLRSILDGELRR
ncbi:MAG: sigma factor-like helix-turn-helix DNA-binding protein, partial [Planctomycetota bacterium]